MTVNVDRIPLPAPTPRPRLSPRFTGRGRELDQLHANLMQFGRVVLVGLGGVGKTQISLAYISNHRSEYDALWWVRAEEGAVLADDYVEMAHTYGIPTGAGDTQAQKIVAVRHWLDARERWLLVFDNVEDADAIAPYLPESGSGHIIITSRRRMWWDYATQAIGPWERQESVEFLHSAVPESGIANALADLFGDLPLALEQALAYIQETATPAADYLELVRRRMPELLSTGTASNYSKTVATAWSVSFEKIGRDAPAARSLLQLYSFFASEGIPHSILPEVGGNKLTKELRNLAEDRLVYNRAVSALVRYSLIQATQDSLTIHRLVQAIVRQGLSVADRRRNSSMAVSIMRSVFPRDVGSSTSWSRCLHLLPHALSAAEHARDLGVGLADSTWLFERIGSYLRARGQYREARKAFEAALSILRGSHDFVEPDIADVYNKLGMVLRASGSVSEARDTFLLAEEAERVAGRPESIRMAAILDNLGTINRALDRLATAKESHARALVIKEAALGPEHPHVAVTLSGLATTLREFGELEQAQVAHQRALALRESALGDDHPDVATTLNNLGNVLADLGQLQSAKTLLGRAVATDEAAFGQENPLLAADLNNYGAVLLELGDLDDGRKALERALAMNERLLGADHPDVAAILNNLAVGCSMQGDYRLARTMLMRAIAIYEIAISASHPDVAVILKNVAEASTALGNVQASEDAADRARIIEDSRAGVSTLVRTKWIRIDKDIAIAETEPQP